MLRRNFRIAVTLAGGREKKLSSLGAGEFEGVQSTCRADTHRFDRMFQVVRRAGWRSEMENIADRAVDA